LGRVVKNLVGRERGGERVPKNLRMRWMRPKEQGAWAELCFMARAMEERLAPSRPWADGRFDVGVDYKELRSRVQVKSTVYKRRGESYSLNVMGPGRSPYKDGEIDFVAVYLIPEDTWYIVPYDRMVGKKGRRCSIHFTVGAKREKYGDCKEAWWLLRGEKGPGEKRGGEVPVSRGERELFRSLPHSF